MSDVEERLRQLRPRKAPIEIYERARLGPPVRPAVRRDHWKEALMATAAAGLIGLLVWTMVPQEEKRTPAKAQDSARAKEIDQWIVRLGHDDPAEREKAEKQIEGLAKDLAHALASLVKAGKSDDAEVRARAERVRKALLSAVAGLTRPATDDPSIAELDAKIRENPGDATLYVRRGELRMKAKDRVGALKDAEEALRLNPASAEAHLLRGRARPNNLFANAIDDFTRAIELDPRRAEPYVERGVERMKKGEFEAAIADLCRAIELRPGFPRAHANRGAARAAKGDIEGAIQDYEAALWDGEGEPGSERWEEELRKLKSRKR